MASDLWYRNATIYEVYLRSFADGNGDGIGDIPGLTERLDYLADLGIDCIWLLPFYPSPLRDDGYDVADYCAIHPDYGTLEDFEELLQRAHARGMRVLIDLVLNHTSDQHPWFQQARSPDSPYHDYYVWSEDPGRFPEARIVFLDTERSNWSWDNKAGKYFWHRFYAFQPDLNFDNPAVQAEILNVVKFWCERGVDGFRLDAVPYLFERPGTSCENLPETHAFLRRMRSYIDAQFPGRVLLAEANQRPHDLVPYFGAGDELHLAFHFPLMPRIFEALRREDRAPIVRVLESTPQIPEGCSWCTFLRNHDELTLEMLDPAERTWMWREFAPEPRMRLNLGIRRRLAPLLGGDQQRLKLAHALLLSLPGVPVLYYGDEIGMGDDIGLEDRRGLRTAMQWNASHMAGFSPTDNAPTPVIAAGDYAYPRVNVAAQQADTGSLWQALRHLLEVRHDNPAFSLGTTEFLAPPDPAVLAIVRRSESATVVALHNLSSRPASASLPGDPGAYVDLLCQEPARASTSLVLDPLEYRWFSSSAS